MGILSPGDAEGVSSAASGKVPHLGLLGELKGKKTTGNVSLFLYKFKRTRQ